MDLSQEHRNEIITLHKTEQYSNGAISRVLGISDRTVDKVVALWNQTGSVCTRRMGRPQVNRRLSVRAERAIVRKSVECPRLTARQIRGNNPAFPSVSLGTVQRIHQKYGRMAIRSRSSPKLNAKQRSVRLQWAKA
jgi:hypothetical protein